jgi:hypothetical protein
MLLEWVSMKLRQHGKMVSMKLKQRGKMTTLGHD